MATIQGVYVALFGRPADPAGLAYFNGVTSNGANLSAIGNLAGQKEYTDRFTGQTNIQIINTIYNSLFGRNADAAGLEFFAKALQSGSLTINNIAVAILDGAQGDDKLIVTNKLTAADAFTKAIDTATEAAAYTGTKGADAGRAFLAPVTKAATTIPTAAATDKAVADLVVTGTGGVSLAITGAAADVVSPTASDAKLKTTNGDDTITVTAPLAAQAIDGGLGTDNLVLKGVIGAYAPAADIIKNIEKVTAAGGAAAIDLVNVKGVTAVSNEASTAAVSFANLEATTVNLGLKGTLAETTSFTYAAAPTAATTLTLEGAVVAAGKAVTIASGGETLNIAVNGKSTVDSFKDATAKTIVISGTGDLTLGSATAANNDFTAATKIDASALAGKLTLDLSAATKAVTVTGTNNADAISLDAAGTKDVVVYNKTETSTYSSFETLKNFTSAEDKIDLKAFAFAKTGITVLNNLVDGASYAASSSVATYVDGNGDTFVFADTNNDSKINLATDFAIKIVGNGALTATEFTFA